MKRPEFGTPHWWEFAAIAWAVGLAMLSAGCRMGDADGVLGPKTKAAGARFGIEFKG